MGLFACFLPGGERAVCEVHAKAGTETLGSTLASPKVDTDVQGVRPFLHVQDSIEEVMIESLIIAGVHASGGRRVSLRTEKACACASEFR